MNNKNFNSTVVCWIDFTVMFILSLFCLLYISHNGKVFAERNIQFSFLNFPIFIGEFLLMGCGILFSIRMALAGIKWNRWIVLLVVFYAFMMIKAVTGYIQYGPLALRNAATFYYFTFAVISYYCYRSEFFKWWVILVYAGILQWVLFGGQFHDWWLMPRIFIGLVLAYKFPDRRVGFLIAASVLLLTPYRYFLDNSRAIILGNFASVSFLVIACIWTVLEKRRLMTLISSALIISLFGLYVFHFSGNKYAQGIVSVDRLQDLYAEIDAIIQERKSRFKSMEISTVQIYHPETAPEIQEVPSPEPASDSGGNQDSFHANNAQTNDEPAVTQIKKDFKDDPERNKLIREMKIGNSVFRLLIWRDAKKEILDKKPVFGFDFGKPFRSESLEIVRWGMDDWARDGWIAMHNSYLEIIYRAGVLGVSFIVLIWSVFVYISGIFVRKKSVVGLLLCACLLVPLTAAYFSVSFELPCAAIPIWTLYGFILAYAHRELNKSQIVTDCNDRTV
jgi:hypothetical protein